MPWKVSEKECSGYLKKWATFGYDSRWFTVGEDNILRYYENSIDLDEYLGQLHVDEITIIDEKENKFILTDKKEKYNLMAGSFDEKKKWMAELIKRGASFDSLPSKKGVERVLSKLEDYCGYLEKWATILYMKRWFVLDEEYLSYYKSKGDKDHAGRLLIKEIIGSDDDEDKEEMKFILTDGKEKYELMAGTKKEKTEWVAELKKRGARWEDSEEAKDVEYYGELIPSLAFPNNYNEKELKERELNQKTHAKNVAIVATALENGMRLAVKAFVPFGDLALLAANLSITTGKKIFDVFTTVSVKDMQSHLQDESTKKRFEDALKLMQAEMKATQKRYENLFMNDFSLEEKKAEIPVAVHSFEKTLALFSLEDDKFFLNAFLMSPFLKEFAVLFLAFSKLASILHPKYNKELGEQLQICADILKAYKSVVIKERMAAIVHSGKTVAKTVQSVGKPVVNIPEAIWKGVGDAKMRMALPMDKIKDKLYPTPTGLQSKWAYPRDEGIFEGEEFYEHYKAQVKKVYQTYFDEIIIPILDSKLVKDL